MDESRLEAIEEWLTGRWLAEPIDDRDALYDVAVALLAEVRHLQGPKGVCAACKKQYRGHYENACSERCNQWLRGPHTGGHC